jgi:NIMA (never in mitosis gene a)-related kinase 8
VPRILPGLMDVAIKHVACGISFLVLLTERNILMTNGNGSQGCLGHGDYEDGVRLSFLLRVAFLSFVSSFVACSGTTLSALVFGLHEGVSLEVLIVSHRSQFLKGIGRTGSRLE